MEEGATCKRDCCAGSRLQKLGQVWHTIGQEHSTTMIGQQTVELLILDPNLSGVYFNAPCSPQFEDPMLELVRIVEHGREAF